MAAPTLRDVTKIPGIVIDAWSEYSNGEDGEGVRGFFRDYTINIPEFWHIVSAQAHAHEDASFFPRVRIWRSGALDWDGPLYTGEDLETLGDAQASADRNAVNRILEIAEELCATEPLYRELALASGFLDPSESLPGHSEELRRRSANTAALLRSLEARGAEASLGSVLPDALRVAEEWANIAASGSPLRDEASVWVARALELILDIVKPNVREIMAVHRVKLFQEKPLYRKYALAEALNGATRASVQAATARAAIDEVVRSYSTHAEGLTVECSNSPEWNQNFKPVLESSLIALLREVEPILYDALVRSMSPQRPHLIMSAPTVVTLREVQGVADGALPSNPEED